MEEESTRIEKWSFLLINGKSGNIEVKNAKFDKGQLTNIDEIRNYPKEDSEGKTIDHTAELANKLKRDSYIKFFKKPFKNLLFLTGAGSSMDVGGKSMYQLWDIAERKFHIEEKEGKIIESDFRLLCTKIHFDY